MYCGPKYFKPTPRGITPRRLSAAKRFLAKERDRYALFAGEVAAEQPTPEERIINHDAGFEEWWQEMRDTRAADWRKARQQLAEMSPDFRAAALTMWNRRIYPADPAYLLSLIRQICSGELDPVKYDAELERCKELGRQARERAAMRQEVGCA